MSFTPRWIIKRYRKFRARCYVSLSRWRGEVAVLSFRWSRSDKYSWAVAGMGMHATLSFPIRATFAVYFAKRAEERVETGTRWLNTWRGGRHTSMVATTVLMHPLASDAPPCWSRTSSWRMTTGVGGEQHVIAWVRDRAGRYVSRNRKGGRELRSRSGIEGFKRLSRENLMEW